MHLLLNAGDEEEVSLTSEPQIQRKKTKKSEVHTAGQRIVYVLLLYTPTGSSGSV